MENTVIKVLNREHGKQVIEYWQSLGVDTRTLIGSQNEEKGHTFIYYGVLEGTFACYCINEVRRLNAKIIELPALTYPRVMEVSMDGHEWYKRVVFMEKLGHYLAWSKAESIEEADQEVRSLSWPHAREINTPLKVTLSQVAERFGVEQIEIVENHEIQN